MKGTVHIFQVFRFDESPLHGFVNLMNAFSIAISLRPILYPILQTGNTRPVGITAGHSKPVTYIKMDDVNDDKDKDEAVSWKPAPLC